MACREVEMGKNKCERYWPGPGQTMDIGAIQVSTVSWWDCLVVVCRVQGTCRVQSTCRVLRDGGLPPPPLSKIPPPPPLLNQHKYYSKVGFLKHKQQQSDNYCSKKVRKISSQRRVKALFCNRHCFLVGGGRQMISPPPPPPLFQKSCMKP